MQTVFFLERKLSCIHEFQDGFRFNCKSDSIMYFHVKHFLGCKAKGLKIFSSLPLDMLSIPLSLINLRLPNIWNWYHILHANVEMIDGKINIKGASYTQESFKTFIFLLPYYENAISLKSLISVW